MKPRCFSPSGIRIVFCVLSMLFAGSGAWIHAQAPVVTQQPASTNLAFKDILLLSVRANGSGLPLSFQWRHEGTNLVGYRSGDLQMYPPSVERAGKFDCVVATALGSVTSQVATVTLTPPREMAIIQQPADTNVFNKEYVYLRARVTTETDVDYQWFKDGVALPTGRGTAYWSTQTNYVGLALLNLSPGDTKRTGDYKVVFTDPLGRQLTSQTVHVEIIPPGPPIIVSQPEDVVWYPRRPVQLRVGAISGGTQIQYQWQRGGSNLSDVIIGSTVSGSYTSNLVVNPSDPKILGDYRVVVSDPVGGSVTSRVAHVTAGALTPPLILAQPSSLDAGYGDPVSFSLGVDGPGPFYITWLHAGTNLPVAYPSQDPQQAFTNSYGIRTAFPADAGDYWAVVTNSYGAVTSTVARLTVTIPTNSAPVILGISSNLVAHIGQYNWQTTTNQFAGSSPFSGTTIPRILSFNAVLGTAPFGASGDWQLALLSSNRFFVGANAGLGAAQGTWGYVPGASGFIGILLTNLPRTGDISRLELFESGQYGMGLYANNQMSRINFQSGNYLVFGPRRPATNTFYVDIGFKNTSSFGFSYTVNWLKDGSPIGFGSSRSAAGYPYAVVTTELPSTAGVPPGRRWQLTVSDVMPRDAGTYQPVVVFYGNGPISTNFAPPISFSVGGGWGATNAPRIDSVVELRTDGSDEMSSFQALPDGGALLGSKASFVAAGSDQLRITSIDPSGRTNWTTAPLWPATTPGYSRIARILGDGIGLPYYALQSASGALLARLARTTNVTTVQTNYSYSLAWSAASAYRQPDDALVRGSAYVGLVPSTTNLVLGGTYDRGGIEFKVAGSPSVLLTNFNPSTASFLGQKDIYLASYTTNGVLRWARHYGGGDDDMLLSLTSDPSGNLYLGGLISGKADFGGVSVLGQIVTNADRSTYTPKDAFIAKISPEGAGIWVTPLLSRLQLLGQIANSARVLAVAPDSKGRVYFVAQNGDVGTAVISIGLLGTTGDLLWIRDLHTAGTPSLAVDVNDQAVVAESVLPLGTSIGESELFKPAGGTVLARFAPSGEMIWLRPLDQKVSFTDEGRPALPFGIGFDAKGQLLIGGTLPSRLGGSSSTRGSGADFDGLELLRTNLNYNDGYDLFVARLAPAFVSQAPALTLSPGPAAPLLQDSIALVGSAQGYPEPAYQWLRDGVPLPGATNRVLELNRIARTNAGNYQLIASNSIGVVVSDPASVKPRIRPGMEGWDLVTSTSPFTGIPYGFGTDNEGRIYVLRSDLGGYQFFERWAPDGTVVWRYNGRLDSNSPGFALQNQFRTFRVTPAGAVLIIGSQFDLINGSWRETLAAVRVDPATGKNLWSQRLGTAVEGARVLAASTLVAGEYRLLVSLNGAVTLRRFAIADGLELPALAMTGLKAGTQLQLGTVAIEASGSFLAAFNRQQAVNTGFTNFPALTSTGSLVVVRYSTNGTPLWQKELSFPSQLVSAPRLVPDSLGNAYLDFDFAGQAASPLTLGTNRTAGLSGIVKFASDGSILWAKAWDFHVQDMELGADNVLNLSGWFDGVYDAQTRQYSVGFGTNRFQGFVRADAYIARCSVDGAELMFRQAGTERIVVPGNGIGFFVASNENGEVSLLGNALFPWSGGEFDFGDAAFIFPPLVNTYNRGGDATIFYVARLQTGAKPPVVTPASIQFTPPAPGATGMSLSWPPGYSLQQAADLSTGWKTVTSNSPYTVLFSASTSGFFRVVKSP